jgi:hypothetical protein
MEDPLKFETEGRAVARPLACIITHVTTPVSRVTDDAPYDSRASGFNSPKPDGRDAPPPSQNPALSSYSSINE